MKKQGKRKAVSRREFLKELGASAVGAAVISEKLLGPYTVEAATGKSIVAVHSGVSESAAEVKGLQSLLQSLLTEIISASGNGDSGVLLNCRLNVTSESKAAPVWYGWVESKGLQKLSKRGGNLPANVIGGDRISNVYKECYDNPGDVRRRKYPDDAKKEKVPDEKGKPAFSIDARYRLNWRRYVLIKAGSIKMGTVTVGFRSEPKKPDDVEARLKYLATDANSPLVKYLENTFTLKGASYSKS
jgi:hypothetical protein